jgi:hypothetical protein
VDVPRARKAATGSATTSTAAFTTAAPVAMPVPARLTPMQAARLEPAALAAILASPNAANANLTLMKSASICGHFPLCRAHRRLISNSAASAITNATRRTMPRRFALPHPDQDARAEIAAARFATKAFPVAVTAASIYPLTRTTAVHAGMLVRLGSSATRGIVAVRKAAAPGLSIRVTGNVRLAQQGPFPLAEVLGVHRARRARSPRPQAVLLARPVPREAFVVRRVP